MRIFTIAVVACGALLLGGQRSQAGTIFTFLNQVTAISSTAPDANADASHGFFDGNNTGSEPNLLTYLNSGLDGNGDPYILSLSDSDPSETFRLSDGGMFSTTATFATDANGDTDFSPGQTVDSLQGVKIDTTDIWSNLGTTNFTKTGGNDGGPFAASVFVDEEGNGVEPGRSGTLTLAAGFTPLNGTYVLALKSGDRFGVYAFQNLVNVTSFNFDTSDSFQQGLSHATLYFNGPSTSVVPEPSSWAIFGLAAIGMVWTVARRRNQVAPQMV